MKVLKYILFSVLFICSNIAIAQFQKGFDAKEATDMMALNNSFTFIKVFNTDTAIIPNGYERIYRSGVVGLDNQYQIWKNKKFAVISFRGSTTKQESWLENLYSAMIPSTGEVTLPGSEVVNYKFAKDTAAHVHAGWTLGLLFMVRDLTYHIKNLNQQGIYNIIFTGHSQGGALAHLARAYFENISKAAISPKNNFKTYAFASPMPGNKVFAEEYNRRFAFKKSSYSIINPKDMVPKMPITLYNGKVFDPEQIGNLLINSSFSNATGILATRLVSKWFVKDPDAYYIKKAGVDIEEQVSKKIGKIIMPKYCSDQTYTTLENRILLGPFINVEDQLKADSVNIDSLQAIPFYGNNLTIQTGSFAQHKPFNYYLYLLKQYYPDKYIETKKKYRVID
jgi:hypothetical protein